MKVYQRKTEQQTDWTDTSSDWVIRTLRHYGDEEFNAQSNDEILGQVEKGSITQAASFAVQVIHRPDPKPPTKTVDPAKSDYL